MKSKCIVLLCLLSVLKPSLGSPLEIIVPLFQTENYPGIPIVASFSREEDTEEVAENRQDVVQEPVKQPVKEPVKESVKAKVEGRQVSSIPAPDAPDKPKLNILEVLKGMGSAIQLLIRQPNPVVGDSRSEATQGVAMTEEAKEKYRQQAEHLRSEINRRSGQLQRVVSAAIDSLNNKGDVVLKKILENLQTRLGQAKVRADKILKEPESGELAVRTLNSINQGMGNLAALVQHVLSRVNISINVDLKEGALKSVGVTTPSTVSTTTSPTKSTVTPSSSIPSPV